MALFKRRRETAPAEPDEALPFLSVDDAQRVRALAREAFAAEGLEVTVHAQHLSDDAGREFGLWNVAAACQQSRPGEWPAIVREHARRVLAAADAPSAFEGLTPADAATSTYARIYTLDEVHDPDRYPHVEFAPGLIEMLALDLPHAIAGYTKEEAERLGGFAALREHGFANLRRLPVEEHERLDAPNGGHVHVVAGDSPYTASLALVLPDLMARVGDTAPAPHGWLLAVPNRNHVCWHAIRDLSVLTSVEVLVTLARRGADTPGALSEHVFWRAPDGYRRLTRYDGAQVAIDADEDFTAVLNALPQAP